jgi:hypothetical protein
VADRRLAQAQRLGEVAHACFGVGLCLDEAQQSESRGISEHLECGSELVGFVRLQWLLQKWGTARSAHSGQNTGSSSEMSRVGARLVRCVLVLTRLPAALGAL